jgi:hypothetical protein
MCGVFINESSLNYLSRDSQMNPKAGILKTSTIGCGFNQEPKSLDIFDLLNGCSEIVFI